MEKYIKWVPLSLFTLTLGKILIVGATWESVGLAFIAGALAALYEHKNQDKAVKTLEAKMEVLATTINNQAKAIEEIRNSVGSVRIAQQAKSLQPTPSAPMQRIF
jgi:uncharacterized protein involved in exopolysaccharide biosynthesis